MKHSFPFLGAMLTVLTTFAAAPNIPELKDFRAPAAVPRECVKGFLWLEAESFADYGEWKLDTQFTHKMGSAYLIAAGLGRPIQSATTTIRIPTAGVWHVWVRTKDWLPEFSPGKFAVCVNGVSQAVNGASKKDGWRWEKGGDFDLPAGEATIELKDLSGAFARCDALLFTLDGGFKPSDEAEDVAADRLKYTGEDGTIDDGGAYDVVVVGAGPGGMGAALSAARTGAKTALVHDRPVLGGNSSCELGVGTDGAAGSHPNGKRNSRESGLCEEANLLRAQVNPKTMSAAYRLMAEREPKLEVFSNQRVLAVEKDGGAITAVLSRNTLTGKRMHFKAKIFIDCTGDGWVGYFADAEYMFGREAQSEYNEAQAPETRDNLTMSGCLMGGCVGYRYEMRKQPVPYETPEWARVLPEGFTRRVQSVSPAWWLEHGGRFDDTVDPERARDELIRISFAYWGWLKNEWSGKADAVNAELTWVPYMNARREGFRLKGDYVLTANDALEARMFPDRISYGGWPLDTHDPLGMENPNGNGYWHSHPGVPEYSIPYRVLYSHNITNLMFAGRCQSVTHIALGSTRVEATIFTLGQAAGTAAAMAIAKGLTPREFGQKHIVELQQRLLKDDQFIPQLRNEDPLDLARKAKVTATSSMDIVTYDRKEPGLRARQKVNRHVLNMKRATCFARWDVENLEGIECLLESQLAEPVEITATIYETDDPSTGPDGADLLATVKGSVPPKAESFVLFAPEKPLKLTKSHVWIVLPPQDDVYWLLRDKATDSKGGRAWQGWKFVQSQQYAIVTRPLLHHALDTAPEQVIDGVSRPVDDCVHGWISSPDEKLPQSLKLDFEEPVSAKEIRLTFDTDLTPSRVYLAPMPRQLVKSYVVEGYDGKTWKTLAEETENKLRLRIHPFDEQKLSAVRVTVRETWGDASARIFEVRLY